MAQSRFARTFMWTVLALSIIFLIITSVYWKKFKTQFRYVQAPFKKASPGFDNVTIPKPHAKRKKVLILFYSTFFGSPVICGKSGLCNNKSLKQCKVPCEVTTNRSLAPNASIIMIHARDPNPLPPLQYSHVPLGLLTWENPVYTPVLHNKEYLARFSYLMSYRPDVADFFLPSFDKPSLDRPIPFANKTGLIAAVFSNCETGRTAYLRELMKHIQVDSYGGCLRNKNNLQNRYVGEFKLAKLKLLRAYKFTIVFHNQDCAYFIDDQLTHALSAGSVPVYMGSDKVDELLGGNLHDSIIKVKDFETPKKLADYLMFVSKNETLYNGYLRWKYEGFQFPQSFLDTPQGRAWQYPEPLYCGTVCKTMADVADKKIEMKPKGAVKPDYCKPREVKDWLKV